MIPGFNAGGVSWFARELRLEGVTERRAVLDRIEDRGDADARSAIELGGRCLRVFVNSQELTGAPEFLRLPFLRMGDQPLLSYTLADKLERLDRINDLLDRLLADLDQGSDPAIDPHATQPDPAAGTATKPSGVRAPHGEPGLDFGELESYLTGIARRNRAEGGARPVQVLLSFVEIPPRWILDAPKESTCRDSRRNYCFESLWHKWIQVHIRIARRTVRRCIEIANNAGQDLLAGVGIVNEPDYEWLPDEYRIEKALAPIVNPLHKYVTELHLNQIPGRLTSRAIETAPWASYRMQDGEWPAEPVPSVPLLEFPWGPKLDWYVKAFADFHTHLSFAVRDELHRAGSPARVVSCSVTHNNVLYFAQMYGANPEVFTYVDAIGVHPYHFPGHDILDDRFRNPEPWPDWRQATPRAYARDCFKRFDFIEEIARLTRAADPAGSFGLAGKAIWVTEFGIPTKSPGETNRRNAAHVPLIRRRAEPAGEDTSAVWEDLWDAFLRQVTPEYLKDLGVEAFFFYSLRETKVRGVDQNDDDRSNFALLHRDGTPRLDAETGARLLAFNRRLDR